MSEAPTRPGLTPRELQVLAEIAAGQHNREIAADLGIAPDTVKGIVRRVFRKLGVRNRAQAAALAAGVIR